MLSKLFDLEDYAGTYRETRNAYLKAVIAVASKDNGVRCFGTQNRDHAVVGIETPAYVQRCKRTGLLILCKTEGELSRMTQERHVGTARSCLADIDHGEPQRSTDRRVRAVAGTQGARA